MENSGVVLVSFFAEDPRIAADLVNILAGLHIEQDLERKYGATREAAKWLDSKLVELRKTLKDSEYELQKYKEKIVLYHSKISRT